MCGIAGFFGRTPRSEPLAQAMLQALASRGPDAQHIQYWDRQGTPAHSATGVHALLHARLSIMDPRPEADQPMTNPERDIWICYNGEVYGWQNDAKELSE